MRRNLVAGAVVLLSVACAHAQLGSAAALAGASPASNAKQIRAADRALQQNVRRALAKTKGLEVIDIAIHARSGDVLLEGSVPEQSEIDLATRVAYGVPGETR